MDEVIKSTIARGGLNFIDDATVEENGLVARVVINPPFLCGLSGSRTVSGGIILDAICQAGALFALLQLPESRRITVAGADKVCWKQPVYPGDHLTTIPTLLYRGPRMWRFRLVASREGVVVATAEALFVEKQ